MVAILKIPTDLFCIIPVDISNKPEAFLKLNPDGTVPVLVDRSDKQMISDSGKIVQYIDSLFLDPDVRVGYTGPARDATDAVFGKLAAWLKDSRLDQTEKLRSALTAELSKCNDYLSSVSDGFLLGDSLCDLDCSVLPKLRHVQVAGNYFRNFDIPEHHSALLGYIRRGEATDVFKQTCPEDREIIHGWAQHGVTVLNK
ncbi:glutathione S-transferase DHAR1, mitochondrial-like isoform X2 [Gigantopelta aegis]|nr:glutathione S-transferase DHAR1, mitochondrial-like isoform X2 [Gigantopelta aegis]